MLISPNQLVQVDSVEFWYEDLAYRRLRFKDEQIYGIECMEKHEGYAT